ncbi:MAG TPA: hypothetical protein VFD49_07270 [Candidatus Dormibacteraeota bacterium]|nr:hypothetical protein [Candidatus Dormibacteraeota bacterium]
MVGVVIGVVACLVTTRSRRRPESSTTQAATEAPAATEASAAAEVNPTDQVERLEVEVEDVVAELERRYQGRKADDAPESADAAEKARPGARGRSRR